MNINKKGDIYLNSGDIKNIFNLTKEEISILDSSKNINIPFKYFTEELYAKFNIKNIFNSYDVFNEHVCSLRDLEIKKKNDLKNQQEIDRLERERIRAEMEIYKIELSKTVRDNFAKVWFRNNNTKYHIHVGATNSGKTHHAIQQLIKSSKGVYLAPLRLLAFEVQEKILSYNINCNLITGEEKIDNQAYITASTIEMMDHTQSYDCIVIDESFMISDPIRGKQWFKSIMESNSNEIHIISSLESLELIKSLLTITNKPFEIHRYERKVLLEPSDCVYDPKKILNKTVFVTFSRINVLREKQRLENEGHKVSVLYGNLPPEVKKQQMQKFINGENNVCVSTDVIGMGLNLPCDHICFLSLEKYDGDNMRFINNTEVKQIAGRAGRYGLSEKGMVWCMNKGHSTYVNQILRSNKIRNISYGYCPIDYETLIRLPPETLLKKLHFYDQLTLIPEELKNVIRVENIDKYIELCRSSDLIDKLPLDYAWKLINMPTKRNSMEIWHKMIKCVYHKKALRITMSDKAPHIHDIYSLKDVEDMVSTIELVLYFSNISIFKDLCSEIDLGKLHDIRYKYIDAITNYLLKKRKAIK